MKKPIPLSEVSGNTLSELCCLLREFEQAIHSYSHVSEHLPKSIKAEIDKFDKKIEKEREKRGY